VLISAKEKPPHDRRQNPTRLDFATWGKGSVPATNCYAKSEMHTVGGRIILPKWHAYASNSFWQSYAAIA
jgi:hypothetical protein